VALAECCFNPEKLFGAVISFNAGDMSAATVLFNESQSRIVISIAPTDLEKVISLLRDSSVPFEQLGKVSAEELRIRVSDDTLRWKIADLYDDWWNAIRHAVEEGTERIPSL
jgi:phosphoribosylformylglycinamidine synthase